jgi:hypothetical protein
MMTQAIGNVTIIREFGYWVIKLEKISYLGNTNEVVITLELPISNSLE